MAATLRRNTTMSSDAAMAKFLYTILKQLDLRSIDWAEVAVQLDITNGHAARMRYSRFKQQMEGYSPVPRPRKTQAKRAPKHKPPIEEDKSAMQVKLEHKEIFSTDGHDSPSLPAENQTTVTSEITPYGMPEHSTIKAEVFDDGDISPLTRPLHYSFEDPDVQMISINPCAPTVCESVSPYSMNGMPHTHHGPMYHSMVHSTGLEHGYNPGVQTESPRTFGTTYIDLYADQNGMDGNDHRMLKMEERWDSCYSSSTRC